MTRNKRERTNLRILVAVLAQPEDDALDALRDLLPDAPWLAEGISELERVPHEHWQAEYTRLFISGWPKTACPPFESAYRHGQMGGTAVTELADLYLRAGLQAREAPPDYLGTMLECAAWLAGQADGAALLRELEDEHLRRWLPRFAQDLQERSKLVLYRTVGARLADLFHDEGADRA